jgi:predicted NBD/HSP70 family sugar kinase
MMPAAMLGEARYGAARGIRDASTVTLGTGIGGGLMLDGQIRRGLHGSAGEIGLTRVVRLDRDGSPEWVALEDLASPGGLSRTAGLSMETLVISAEAGDAEARGTGTRL